MLFAASLKINFNFYIFQFQIQYFQKNMQNYFWWPNNSPLYSPINSIPHNNTYPPPPSFNSPPPKELEELQKKFQRLEKQNQELKKQLKSLKTYEEKMPKRRVVRRPENQLAKIYSCPYQKCKKEYASNLALNLHIKIKHKGGNKKQRDLLAEAIIKAEKEGKSRPQSTIILPPNYVENYRNRKLWTREEEQFEENVKYEEEEIQN